MSKIGKKLIKLPPNISVEVGDGKIKVKGEKGQIEIPLLEGVKPSLENNEVKFELTQDSKQARSNWGTERSLVFNAVFGLSQGFEKTLILEGIGYRINKEGEDLILNLGFSHPVRYKKPEGISFEIEKNSILKVKGTDKAQVSQIAADIRSLKKPEPYKGKGFRYSDEIIRRKASKKVAGQSSQA